MKFKAVIESGGAGSAHQELLLHVLQALSRLDRSSERRGARGSAGAVPASVVLKLSPDSFALCHQAGADEGSQTWSYFHVDKLFQEYRIESKRGNRIDLEAPIANLAHVFNSCLHSDRTTMRLANGQDGRPILGFDFALAGNATDHRVEQEVPVRVIPEQEADLVKEPALPEPEYQIELPSSLARLKNLLDKMRQVGAQHVYVEAAQERATGTALGTAAGGTGPGPGAVAGGGRAWLRLVAEAELVTISTTFPSLGLVSEGKREATPDQPVKLLLSLRRLGEVLAAFQMVSAEAHIACLLEGKALVLYALLPRQLGSLISYTPCLMP